MFGWKKINNGALCSITTIPDNFIRVDSSKNATNNNIRTNTSKNNTAAILISATLLCIMAYYMLRWWKNVDRRHVRQRLDAI